MQNSKSIHQFKLFNYVGRFEKSCETSNSLVLCCCCFTLSLKIVLHIEQNSSSYRKQNKIVISNLRWILLSLQGARKALTNEVDVPWLPHVSGLTVGFQALSLLLLCSSGHWRKERGGV